MLHEIRITYRLLVSRFPSVNLRGSTFHMGVGFGWRIGNTLAVGAGANYATVDELVQEYQDVRTSTTLCQTDGGFQNVVEQKTQNIRQHLVAYAVQPTLGMQWAFADRWSFGASFKAGTYVSQNFEQSYEDRSMSLDAATQAEVDATTGEVVGSGVVARQNDAVNKSDNPLGTLPLQGRVGVAFFASTRLLMTMDATYFGAIDSVDSISGVGSLYQKDPVTNYAFGLEYFLIPAVPFRFGVFTNNDARPVVDKNKSGQRDHIDYTGATMFLAWVQPNSQIGAGVMLQQGAGSAQKISGSKQVQDVVANSFTFAFSATHSF